MCNSSRLLPELLVLVERLLKNYFSLSKYLGALVLYIAVTLRLSNMTRANVQC